jgi:arylsulfatase A-like enzyme
MKRGPVSDRIANCESIPDDRKAPMKLSTIPNPHCPRIQRTSLTRLAVAVFSVTVALGAVPKPNFVFIITDDQRWDAMSVVQQEQGERARFPWLKTPNMDRLASEGVRFRNAFVTLSLCSPSRAAFLTGRYNHINGITTNGQALPEDAVTHASLLRDAGYRTAYIGKWHMGQQRGQRPGFDYSASFVGQGIYIDCPIEINGEPVASKGWVDDVSTDYAIGWIREHHDRPFSMVLGFKSPHSPRGGDNLPDRLRGLYSNEKSRPTPNMGVQPIYRKPGSTSLGLAENSIHLDYMRHITGVDQNVGRLLDALETIGIAEDTVIVYTSDNGYYLGEHCLGDKRSLYEESIRIPMLVRYPRMFPEGRLVDEMVLNIDLAPTLLDLAGVTIPESMQGASWKDLAAGKQPAKWRSSFLAEYYKELGDAPTMAGIRTATSKFIHYPNHPEWTEVFDLINDPYEIANLARESKLSEDLRVEFEAQVKATGYVEKPAKKH